MMGDVSGNVFTISPIMDDDFFNGQATLSTSPELERATAYYAGKKKYAKAAHAALYSGFVQQHYNEKEAAIRSFKEAKHMTPMICEKGRRGHPLTDEQKESNRQKSKVRSRVEHVFGFMEQTMGRLIFRGVGIIRAKANIALTNLVYNMCRLVQLKKYQPNLIAIQ